MIKRFLVPFVVAQLLFTAISASAATWSPLSTANPGFTYSPNPATAILYYNAELTPQNPNNIESLVEEQFGILYNTPINVSFVGDDESGSNTFSSNTAFNYLAIHFGKGELFFYWDQAINSFSISEYEAFFGQGGGLSNYRAYSDGLSEVPVPAAAWLFGSALLGLMGLRRRM